MAYQEPDPMVPAQEVGAGHYSDGFLRAIDAALAFRDKDRPRSVQQWRVMLAGGGPAPAPSTRGNYSQAVTELAEFVTREIETTFTQIAQRFVAILLPEQSWEGMDDREKLVFLAIVRHVVNLVTAVDRGDVDEALAYDWKAWIDEKLETGA